jgi:putative serine protease PepD
MSDFTNEPTDEPTDAAADVPSESSTQAPLESQFSNGPTQWGTPPSASDDDAVPDRGAREPLHASTSSGLQSPGTVWPRVRQQPSPVGRASSGSMPGARQWLAVAFVAALVGALVGGGVVWATRGPGAPESITIRTAGATPGPAVLTTGQTIPSLVKSVSPSVVSVNVTTAFEEDQGTGMIISSSGLVLTNNHVVAGAEGGQGTITVTRTGTSATLPVTLLGYSAKNDVALLQIQGGSHLPAVTFGNSKSLVVGDAVVAIGNALGLAAGTPTVTQGIVSALGRTVKASSEISSATETLHNMIQTDAAINPGNSGGPLIDSEGEVIGMNTAVAGTTDDGTNAQNIGFAIPAARIEQLLPVLLDAKLIQQKVKKGAYLGVFIVTVKLGLPGYAGLSVSYGAYVSQTVAGLPAAVAGIRAGDVIISINGSVIKTDQDVEAVMERLTPGTTVKVGVVRGKLHLTIPVTVGAPPPVTPR